MSIEDWVIARIEENKDLFTCAEWENIYSNMNLYKKIYMIAMKNTLFL